MNLLRLGLVAVGVVSFSGCAGVTSSYAPPASPTKDGIVYYLPKRPIRVTLTVEKKDAGQETRTLAVDTLSAVPDLSHRYILTHNRSYLGTNTSIVTINDKGLLSSVDSKTTSGVKDILKNLAKAAGSLALAENIDAGSCANSGTYDRVFFIGEHDNFIFCGYQIVVSPLDKTGDLRYAPLKYGIGTQRPENTGNADGFYYRVNIPYRVKVLVGGDEKRDFIVSVPDESPTYFVPAIDSFLSNSHTNVTFSEGVLTGIDQTSESEAVAATALPAEIISAYFKAVGELFSAFKTNDTSEADALSAQVALELAKAKRQACLEAVKTGKTTAEIIAACGGSD